LFSDCQSLLLDICGHPLKMANRNIQRGPPHGRGNQGGRNSGGFGGHAAIARAVAEARAASQEDVPLDDPRHANGAAAALTGLGIPQGLIGQRVLAAQFLSGAPTFDLPAKERGEDGEKKFTGRCRLFVANLPPSVTEDSLRQLFEQYGQVSEVFIGQGKSFAFVKMDTRKHAEEARDALDNKNYEGRTLRVRLAAHAAAVRVKNLSPLVTNELLEYAFSFFGEVERAIVIVDDRGRSVCEGIVEFARKNSAQNCIKRCQTECFLLTSNPAPVIVEPFETRDEEEGFSEKHLNRSGPDYRMEREVGPRFAEPGSFEYDFGCRFKELYEIEKEKRTRLEQEITDARNQLMNQMELQRVEYQTKILREKLKEMEQRAALFGQVKSEDLEIEKRREEERQQREQLLRQREEEILRRAQLADYAGLRRQENDLRMQATALQEMLDRQEVTLSQIGGPDGHNLYGGPRGGPPPGGPYGPGPHDLLDGPPHGIPPFVDDVPYYGMNGMDHRFGGGPPPASQGLPPPPHAYSSPGLGGGRSGGGGGGRQFGNRPAPYGATKRGKKF